MISKPMQYDFGSTMELAEQAIRRRDYSAADALLLRAHAIGHSVKADHLRAHRALIRLGIRKGNPLQVLSQSGLLLLAWLFERNRG